MCAILRTQPVLKQTSQQPKALIHKGKRHTARSG
jgi:hypothetical protein